MSSRTLPGLRARLGIEVPIIQAPMAGGWTTPALVAAVSEAGGLGTLAAARLTATQLRGEIEETRRLTRRPFGVNFQLAGEASPEADARATPEALAEIRRRLGIPTPVPDPSAEPHVSVADGLALALEARVPVVSFALGTPAPWVERVHAAGALVMAAVTTVAEAQEVAAAGADVVVAQGAEAGGHRSTFETGGAAPLPLVGTMALVPAVVDAVALPVVATGGIMDGRGIAAALALGAEAVQLGTRFLLAAEAGTPPSYRRQLLAADETTAVVTDVFSGRPARGLRNAFVREFEATGARPLAWPRQAAAAMDIYRASLADDGEWATLFAGQGLRLARREQPAQEIVRELMAELAAVRSRLAAG
jgi:nitronate monooxygenase